MGYGDLMGYHLGPGWDRDPASLPAPEKVLAILKRYGRIAGKTHAEREVQVEAARAWHGVLVCGRVEAWERAARQAAWTNFVVVTLLLLAAAAATMPPLDLCSSHQFSSFSS